MLRSEGALVREERGSSAACSASAMLCRWARCDAARAEKRGARPLQSGSAAEQPATHSLSCVRARTPLPRAPRGCSRQKRHDCTAKRAFHAIQTVPSRYQNHPSRVEISSVASSCEHVDDTHSGATVAKDASIASNTITKNRIVHAFA